MQQAGLLEVIAGKTRANAASAIVSNFSILEEAYNASLNADGEAAKAMEETLNSIESHISQLNQSISILWENFLSSEVIKFFVDLLNVIVQITDKIGIFGAALGGLGAYLGSKGLGRHTNQGVSI